MHVHDVGNCTNGDVHLLGGSTASEGRVEVCYNNQWGGVCSPSRVTWGVRVASAICKQLGYYSYDAVAFRRGGYYGAATSIHLNVDYCGIHAATLLDCYYYGNARATLGYYNCAGYRDFAVSCAGQ